MDIKDLQSSEIGELIKAFVAARKEYNDPNCNGGGNYGNFPDLDDIHAACEPALLKYGIIFKQGRVFIDGHVLLESKLLHTSGQWMANYMPLFVPENSKKDLDQAYGSSTSYQRRYEAYGMLGISKNDNTEDPDVRPSNNTKPISEAQLGLLKNLLKSQPEREAGLLAEYGIKQLAELPWPHMNEVVDILRKTKE